MLSLHDNATMAMFLDQSGKAVKAKDIYDKLKSEGIRFSYFYSCGTKDEETDMNELYGPEHMYFSQFEAIQEVEDALLKVFEAGAEGYLIKHEILVDGGKIVKTKPDEHIFTKSVTLTFDDEDIEHIFDYGHIQLTLYISPRGMVWYSVG